MILSNDPERVMSLNRGKREIFTLYLNHNPFYFRFVFPEFETVKEAADHMFGVIAEIDPSEDLIESDEKVGPVLQKKIKPKLLKVKQEKPKIPKNEKTEKVITEKQSKIDLKQLEKLNYMMANMWS